MGGRLDRNDREVETSLTESSVVGVVIVGREPLAGASCLYCGERTTRLRFVLVLFVLVLFVLVLFELVLFLRGLRGYVPRSHSSYIPT